MNHDQEFLPTLKAFEADDRRRRLRITFAFVLFALGLIFGCVAGEKIAGLWESITERATPLPTRAMDQRDVFVIGVNRLRAAQPELAAVWYLLYIPDHPSVLMINLYPSGNPEQDQRLVESFEIGPDKKPTRRFLNAVNKIPKTEYITGYLLLDEIALMEIINFMGGVDLGSGLMNGPRALGEIPSPSEDPDEALEMQARLLNGMCQRAGAIQIPRTFDELGNLMPTFMISDLELDQAIDDWLSLRSSGTALNCEFPQIPLVIP